MSAVFCAVAVDLSEPLDVWYDRIDTLTAEQASTLYDMAPMSTESPGDLPPATWDEFTALFDTEAEALASFADLVKELFDSAFHASPVDATVLVLDGKRWAITGECTHGEVSDFYLGFATVFDTQALFTEPSLPV